MTAPIMKSVLAALADTNHCFQGQCLGKNVMSSLNVVTLFFSSSERGLKIAQCLQCMKSSAKLDSIASAARKSLRDDHDDIMLIF
jgi:hypothetical protein